MNTRAGWGAGWGGNRGEEGGAEEFDRAEGRAPWNEVHLVFVRAWEKREAFRFSGPEDKRNWAPCSCLSYTAYKRLFRLNANCFSRKTFSPSPASHSGNNTGGIIVISHSQLYTAVKWIWVFSFNEQHIKCLNKENSTKTQQQSVKYEDRLKKKWTHRYWNDRWQKKNTHTNSSNTLTFSQPSGGSRLNM